jgi:glycosyltransferase involved in cell wall biosynthesis
MSSADTSQPARVALLLATYNGSRYVDAQIRSLKENVTPFTLHWLDDHSTDATREVVRASASNCGIELREWHQSQHQGVPGAFFQLMECVEADVYLFCDQDDIWQPGKIDAAVANLLADAASPALCFSDPLIFYDSEPGSLRRLSEVTAIKSLTALRRSSMFLVTPAMGHTIGFTRGLRECYLKHKDIARRYAAMHDQWMYLIAKGAGTCRMLANSPTTLYRLHQNNTAGVYFTWFGWRSIAHIPQMWRLQRRIRRWASRQAEGFILAAATLPQSPTLERLVALARLIATLDRRQSPLSLLRLARRGAMPPSADFTFWFAAACLSSDAGAG